MRQSLSGGTQGLRCWSPRRRNCARTGSVSCTGAIAVTSGVGICLLEAVALKFVTAEQFDEWVKPEDMVGPK
jgi:hypothetical protein